jgi:hypothetical protein
MTDSTYDLFFTGKDDPRHCVIIGEDKKAVYLCFDTPERGVAQTTTTSVKTFDYSVMVAPRNAESWDHRFIEMKRML